MSEVKRHRRKKGSGSFYQTNGRWVAQMTMPDGRRQYVTGKSFIQVSRKFYLKFPESKLPEEVQQINALAAKEHTAAMLLQCQEQLIDARRTLEQIASEHSASLSIKLLVQGFKKRHPSSAD